MKVYKWLLIVCFFFTVNISAVGQNFNDLQKIADLDFMNGKYVEALEQYNGLIKLEIADSVQLANLYSYAAMCNEELGKNDTALKFYKKALVLHVPQLMIYDKMVALAKTEKDDDAYEFALLQKESEFPDFEVSIQQSLAYHYYNTKQNKKLLACTGKLTEWFPDNTKFFLFEATAKQNLNDIEGAKVAYTKVLSLEPDNAGANMGIGMILYNKANIIYDKMKADYDAINKPSRVDYSNFRTKLDAPKAIYKEALPYLQKAYKNKSYASLKGIIKNIYIRMGDKENADKY